MSNSHRPNPRALVASTYTLCDWADTQTPLVMRDQGPHHHHHTHVTLFLQYDFLAPRTTLLHSPRIHARPLLENVKFSCIMFLCNWVAKIEVPESDIITIMLGMPELVMEKKENSESQFFGEA